MMTPIRSALACNLDTHILQAALPLLEAEKVQALEWSFDALQTHSSLPDWFQELLQTYSRAGRLVGHGVFFSLLSGRWSPQQQAWLDQLRTLADKFAFDHVTEHFGMMTGRDFHKGAPLGVPLTASTLAIGIDRLKRLSDACRCPVGIENLAFAYSMDEVDRHGDFLHRLIEPVDGFIILDLHNLYCQSHNFGIEPLALLRRYPLDRVREIHVSGGSWSDVPSRPGRRIRRDTHNEAVPFTVFDLLEQALDVCPNLLYVVLEQIGDGLRTETQQRHFRQDFLRMDALVQQQNQTLKRPWLRSFHPDPPVVPDAVPYEDADLYAQQVWLAEILETATDYRQARQWLAESSLANSAWEVERWEPAMLETAIAIAQKWQHGFTP